LSSVITTTLLSINECSFDCSNHTTRLLAHSIDIFGDMGAVLVLILPLRLVVAAEIHVVWRQLSILSSSLVTRIPPLRAALPWRRHRDPTADVLHWNATASLSCLFCVSDSDEACMHVMVEVTLVWGGGELLDDLSSDVVVRRWRVNFIPSEFPIRRNMRGYLLPTRWSYRLHKHGAYSGTFRLPAAGSTVVVEAPIDWGSVEALPAPFERCESLATAPRKRQVVRVIPQWLTLGPGRPTLGRGMPLLSQLLQQEPGPSGPPPPSSSSSSESDEGGLPGTGLWYEGEWWPYKDDEGNGDATDGTAGGTTGGGGGVYEEGEYCTLCFYLRIVFIHVCVLYSNCYMLNMFSMGLTFIMAAQHRRRRRFVFPSSFQVIHNVLLNIASLITYNMVSSCVPRTLTLLLFSYAYSGFSAHSRGYARRVSLTVVVAYCCDGKQE